MLAENAVNGTIPFTGLTAPVAEVYSAIQGEGPIVGTRQLFIRFYNCNLRCAWCDTPAALTSTGPCRVESASGSRRFRTIENPFSAERLLSTVAPFLESSPRAVSLTGGEPLLHHRFLREFLPPLKARNVHVYLETNGVLADALPAVLPWVDQIGMDWKLRSSAREADQTAQHRRFLAAAGSRPLFMKLVLTADTDEAELFRAAAIIAELTPAAPIILQPVTPVGGSRAPAPEQLLRWQSLALQIHRDVRVIPQTHVMLGQI